MNHATASFHSVGQQLHAVLRQDMTCAGGFAKACYGPSALKNSANDKPQTREEAARFRRRFREQFLIKITATESMLFLLQYVSEDLDNREKIIVMGDCCYLNPLVRRTFRFLGVYAFGLFATDIFVNAGQVVTGNLAPHFLTVCRPNYTALGCQQAGVFISQQEACTGNEDDVLRARRSFPSKEAALSIYAALYVAMYITCTVKTKGTRLAKPALSLGLMCLAFLTGINRVVEYRNHWSDVIAGFIIGGSIATFMVVGVVQRFKGKPLLSEIPPEESLDSAPMIGHPREENPLEKYITTQLRESGRGLLRFERIPSPSLRSHDIYEARHRGHPHLRRPHHSWSAALIPPLSLLITVQYI
ncbi:hypothetical protein JZ751_025848 [Albula glossodonta]|uniref:Phosphatidic acid phosphatase type 2/haloperoxidase domain-containing protein n=1 Tax=Albula glossodonta TaxID=121402 RepID=A0A8T2NEN1_9TELE|nr:hypothetical protein JZ751_025848 [Albula glossodonta]